MAISEKTHPEPLRFTSSEFETALREGAFSLVYQPIVSGSDSCVMGFEVLTRLSLRGNEVSPNVFIPHAEKNGFIDRLTSWIFGRLATELSRAVINPFWRVHINVSPLQLLESSGRDRLKRDLRSFVEVHHHSLAIEITENRFVLSKNDCEHIGVWMKEVGRGTSDISWYLDDFGRGENFDALRLPIHGLKIDREFSTSGSTSPLRTVEMIARTFGLDVIAEGIETHTDYLRIRKAGVTCFQGFLAWRPLSINQLKDLR
ncbi:MAG: EAL domain-containing protein [Leptospirales bacterium]